MPGHNIGFNVEILQTRFVENMKEKHESHEKLAQTKKNGKNYERN